MSIQIGTLESGCKKDEEYSPSEAIFYTKKGYLRKRLLFQRIILKPLSNIFLGRSWLDVGIFVLNLDTIISSQLLTDSAKHCALAPLI